MSTIKTIPVAENAFVNMLKSLPENMLATIFWKTFVHADTSPLSQEEKNSVAEAREEYKKQQTVKWEDIR